MQASLEDIDWKQMGVFTEQTTFNELLLVYVASTLLLTVCYFLNKMFYPDIVRLIYGE